MSQSNRSRRQFTTEQKVALLRRHLVDKELVSKICEEAQPQPSVFYQWLRQAFENLGAALGPPASNPVDFFGGYASINKEERPYCLSLFVRQAKKAQFRQWSIHRQAKHEVR
jgi:transposase-like protein